jgi:hypothetical protein
MVARRLRLLSRIPASALAIKLKDVAGGIANQASDVGIDLEGESMDSVRVQDSVPAQLAASAEAHVA